MHKPTPPSKTRAEKIPVFKGLQEVLYKKKSTVNSVSGIILENYSKKFHSILGLLLTFYYLHIV